jgi:hypothetical protein
MRALSPALLAHGHPSPLAPVLGSAFALDVLRGARQYRFCGCGRPMRALSPALLAHRHPSLLAPVLAPAFAAAAIRGARLRGGSALTGIRARSLRPSLPPSPGTPAPGTRVSGLRTWSCRVIRVWRDSGLVLYPADGFRRGCRSLNARHCAVSRSAFGTSEGFVAWGATPTLPVLDHLRSRACVGFAPGTARSVTQRCAS